MTPLGLPDPALTDGTVTLRPWRAPDDFPALDAARADPRIPLVTTVPAAGGGTAFRDWVARQTTRRVNGLSLTLAVADAGTDEALGMVGLMNVAPDRSHAELGYWTAPHARGRGLTGRAAALLAGWAWTAFPLARLDAIIAVDNVASRRVAAKAGLAYEGTHAAALRFGDRWLDVVVYAAVRPGLGRVTWAGLAPE